MNISLEFTPTAADLRETMRACRLRRLSLVRILGAVLVLFLGFERLSDVGLDWIFALYVVVAVYLASNRFIVELLLPIILRLSTQPPYRMSINDHSILTEQTKYRQEILWSSFALTGTAREFENLFWLECGRGNVLIPMRAFSSADDLAAFRSLVKEKMGERCHFRDSPVPRG